MDRDTHNLDYIRKDQIIRSNSEKLNGEIKENNIEELTKEDQNDIPFNNQNYSDLLKGITEKLKSTFEQGDQIRIAINSPISQKEPSEIINLTKDIENISKELNELKTTIKEIRSSLSKVLKNQEEEKAERKWVIKMVNQIRSWFKELPRHKKSKKNKSNFIIKIKL